MNINKEFDEKFHCIQRECDGNGNIPVQVDEDEWEAEQCRFHDEYLFPIKQFINEKLEQQKEHYEKELKIADDRWKANEQCREDYNRLLEEYTSNIGLLRQWLNEDRITDADKMVTNEDLEDILIK